MPQNYYRQNSQNERNGRNSFNRKKKSILPIFLIAILIIVISTGIFGYSHYENSINTPINAADTQEILFNIKRGDSTKKIAEQLKEQGLIKDSEIFQLYARLNNLDKEIKTGRFPLQKNQNIKEILEIITSNRQKEMIVTIPEGFTIREIDQVLADQDLITAGEFIQATHDFSNYQKYPFIDQNKVSKLKYPLEGYLFPDTYYISATDFQPHQLIDLMLLTFRNKALPALENNQRSIADLVNVAAMIEEEANKDQDRPLISGIIWKRLDENWQLGIDATLLYQSDSRIITYADLQKDDPYNTRKKVGLPPGPITNPGLASLKAAAQPEASRYYYYLTSSKNGEMVYSVTDAEHNANKSKHL